jgi:phage terminase large subunit
MDELDHEKIETLAETNPARYKVVGLGEYGMPGGTYFDEFRRDIHVIKPFPIPDHWHRYTTKDYGLDMLANYWVAIDTHNVMYVYKELHESNLIISAAAERIKEVNGKDEIKIKYAPPDLENRRQETGKSALDIFRENGESCIVANNRRVDGWLAVKEWLKPYESVDEQTGEKKITAKMLIFDNCVHLIESLEQSVKDEADPNDVATEPHNISHSADAIRYLCIMRQRPTPVVAEQKRDDFGIYKKPENPFECSIPDSFISYGM